MTKPPKLVVVTDAFVSSAQKNHITLFEGSSEEVKIGKEAISKILPALVAADHDSRSDFILSVIMGEKLETEGGEQLSKIIYGSVKTPEFHRSVKDIVETSYVVRAGGPDFDPKHIIGKLTDQEWAKMQYAYAQEAGMRSLVDERVQSEKTAPKPKDGP